MSALRDSYGRTFEYLRLSVTDACNFQCKYCLPNGYRCEGKEAPLTQTEILNLVSAFAALGLWKVRVTGGEPLLRRDIVDIVGGIKSVPGIKEVALSTNGYRLHALLPSLVQNGLDAVNVSVDSLNDERFFAITQRNLGTKVVEGVEAAARLSQLKVKVNSVLMRSTWQRELEEFKSWIKDVPVSVRFIELMRTGKNQDLHREEFVSAECVQTSLSEHGWIPKVRTSGSGPASEYVHEDYAGRLGIIAPYAKSFCDSCNRLRVTSRGELKLCLFGDRVHSLRPLLASSDRREELIETIVNLVGRKAVSHRLAQGDYGSTASLSQIGG